MTLPTTRVERNRSALMALHNLSEKTRQELIPSLRRDTIIAIVECTINIILSNVELTPIQLEWMRSRERDLQHLISKKTSIESKKIILQKGGFLSNLLTPVVGHLKNKK